MLAHSPISSGNKSSRAHSSAFCSVIVSRSVAHVNISYLVETVLEYAQ